MKITNNHKTKTMFRPNIMEKYPFKARGDDKINYYFEK